ncbi:MAG TPA: hypothetical protein VG737_15905 [Cyclobacteriaceae bacterium]|nr:hypothetical protein [Cyclobacteriaceae bacterium]
MKWSLILVLIFTTFDFWAQSPLKIAFEFPEHDVVPEGIAYDPRSQSFFISSTFRRNIIRIDKNGRYGNFVNEQQDSLQGVVGMRVDPTGRYLWAASCNFGRGMPMKNPDSLSEGRTSIHKYEIATGRLLNRYALGNPADPHAFNDLVISKTGTVFITDTRAGRIYTLSKSARDLEVYFQLDKGMYPNGIDITPDGKFLFIAVYARPKNLFIRLEVEKKEYQVIELQANWPAGADGLYYYANSLIAVIPGPGMNKVIRYKLDSKLSEAVEQVVLVNNDPMLSQPSTGVVVNDKFYFVATSNLQLFAKRYRETSGMVDVKEFPPLRVGLVRLK